MWLLAQLFEELPEAGDLDRDESLAAGELSVGARSSSRASSRGDLGKPTRI
jgi:hypothetical protein